MMPMSDNQNKPFTKRVRSVLYRIEDGILVGLLLMMIGLAVTQIFGAMGRSFGGHGGQPAG